MTLVESFAAKCPIHGLVTDDEVDVDFPNGATHAGCGESLNHVRAVAEPTEVPTA